MLANHDAMATIAVTDLRAAMEFYGRTLGLELAETMAGVGTYRSGASTLVVYESEFARTNRATSATWGVGEDFDDVIRRLGEAGVSFQHYDLPGLVREGDVYVAEGFKAAWFTDPDGNILHINNQ